MATKAKRKTAVEKREKEAEVMLATARSVGFLSLVLENYDLHPRRRRNLNIEVLDRWRTECKTSDRICIHVVPAARNSSTVRAEYRCGCIHPSKFDTIARTLIHAAQFDTSVTFHTGQVECGFYDEEPGQPAEFYAHVISPYSILCYAMNSALPEVCRLLNDLILDHAR